MRRRQPHYSGFTAIPTRTGTPLSRLFGDHEVSEIGRLIRGAFRPKDEYLAPILSGVWPMFLTGLEMQRSAGLVLLAFVGEVALNHIECLGHAFMQMWQLRAKRIQRSSTLRITRDASATGRLPVLRPTQTVASNKNASVPCWLRIARFPLLQTSRIVRLKPMD